MPSSERIDAATLAAHQGKWVALSPAGDRLIASSQDLQSLHQDVRAAGEDPDQVILTHVPAGDDGMPLGGLEIE